MGLRKFLFLTGITAVLVLTTAMAIIPAVSALTVSPPSLEITGDPGKKVTGEIELFNERDHLETFYSSFANFESSGESGAPHFIGADGGLATWINIKSKVVLQAGERKTIPFSITIPKNTDPGGYFAAVFWGTQSSEAQGTGQVAIGGKLGILILLKVSGEVKEEGGLLEFNTEEKQKFFSSTPVAFIYRFGNAGGDRITPKGKITVKNLFGSTLATLPANKTEGNILPGSSRKFEAVWGEESQGNEVKKLGFFEMAGRQWSEFHFGVYTAELDLVWGSIAQAVSAQYKFFIVPWQLLLLIMGMLAIVGFLGISGLKKYNRWIVSRATERQNTITKE